MSEIQSFGDTLREAIRDATGVIVEIADDSTPASRAFTDWLLGTQDRTEEGDDVGDQDDE